LTSSASHWEYVLCELTIWRPSPEVCVLYESIRRYIKFAFMYEVFRARADWTFILQSELPAKELRHLPRKRPPRDTTYWEVS
jgi:hypothetical protein